MTINIYTKIRCCTHKFVFHGCSNLPNSPNCPNTKTTTTPNIASLYL